LPVTGLKTATCSPFYGSFGRSFLSFASFRTFPLLLSSSTYLFLSFLFDLFRSSCYQLSSSEMLQPLSFKEHQRAAASKRDPFFFSYQLFPSFTMNFSFSSFFFALASCFQRRTPFPSLPTPPNGTVFWLPVCGPFFPFKLSLAFHFCLCFILGYEVTVP